LWNLPNEFVKTLRILIADDHDIVREGLRKLLEPQPKWVICAEAATGREAVELARQNKPEVAVLDFSMPELNGLEATRQIRKILPRTEVLILTMHDSEQLAREILEAGARGFVLKTHAKRQLVPAVTALAEHKPYFDSQVSELMLEAFLHPETTALKRGAAGRLTSREREIVQLIAEGRTSKEVASVLSVSVKTVEAHRANLMNKLNLHSTSQLVLYAVRNRIVQM
jgi:DNA-binding NarL/FixJ family response regulator